MSNYKCHYDSSVPMWNIYLITNGIPVLVHHVHTKEAARWYCIGQQEQGKRAVVFNDFGHDFEVGVVTELFGEGQPGLSAVSGAIDGFNNLVCRAKSETNKSTIKKIHQSRLHIDMEKLGDIFNLNVLGIGEVYV